MEPRIQYAQTRDGVAIAIWTLGEGTPAIPNLGTPPDAEVVRNHPSGEGLCADQSLA